ncbi:hypothetical protein [Nocardia bovistercoris]|uniref:Uncharacterized protein n=1 Tax=Nocardia bovistercoris TaxID=2785916 RepID=A0A931IC83_9NOCA|nr:hypothetical protein [Nocardia bovistercoris]MBH0778734.1 hypothetical protein [Nocardia bovistercoris]
MTDRAIGLVHIGRSDDIGADHLWIESQARQRGYQLAGVLSIDYDTYMPLTLIVASAAGAKAAVIIAPDLDYFGAAYKAVTTVCALLLPTGLMPCAARTPY